MTDHMAKKRDTPVSAEELRGASHLLDDEYKGALVLLALAQILERLDTIEKNMVCLSLGIELSDD